MRKNFLLLLMIVTGLVTANNTFGQIVNMEDKRYHTDTTGWAGSVGGGPSAGTTAVGWSAVTPAVG